MLPYSDDLIYTPVREKGSIEGQQHQGKKGHAGKAPSVGTHDNEALNWVDGHGAQIGKAEISAAEIADHPHS